LFFFSGESEKSRIGMRIADSQVLFGLFIAVASFAAFLVFGLEYLKRLTNWLKGKKVIILIVAFWTAALSIIVIREYWLLYQTYPHILMDPSYKVAYVNSLSGWVPHLYPLDNLFIFLVSVIAGFAIADLEAALFGFVATALVSTSLGVAYSTFFIWYVLDFGILGFSFFTTILWAAFLNIFRMVFPMAILIAFFGSMFGSVTRAFVQPSAQV
jgi:hypothetical protein